MKVQKWGYTRQIRLEDWVCEFCDKPLEDEAVTTAGGYAHPACDPLTQMLTREISALYDRTFLNKRPGADS